MSKIKDTLPLLRGWGYRFENERLVSPRGRVLAVRTSNRDYLLSTVSCPDGTKVTLPISQVAAYEKYGDDFLLSGLQVRHLNGCRTDNSFGNIALGTQSTNEHDKPAKVRAQSARIARAAQGFTPNNARLTPAQVREIRSRLDESDTRLAADFGVSRRTIYNIRNGTNYTNVE